MEHVTILFDWFCAIIFLGGSLFQHKAVDWWSSHTWIDIQRPFQEPKKNGGTNPIYFRPAYIYQSKISGKIRTIHMALYIYIWYSTKVPPSIGSWNSDWDIIIINHHFNGHFRNRLIGGTNPIYVWPIFEAYVREYPHKIWPYMVQYLQFRILELSLIIIVHIPV